ncbi:MAG: NAD(P)H-hydrate dehydratase [Gemmatimonadetes bacterium]|nr:NAD(P)H-hydrate dehydratase [Gemmatimonadota bacterium]
MIPVLSAAQAAAWDERARLEAGIPSRVLMESAGRGVARVVAREFGADLSRGVIVAAGPGNNGGDGWVAARALQAIGVRVLAAESAGERTPDCAANRVLALATGVEELPAGTPWPAAGLVIDALLGTGAKGAPHGAVGALAERIQAYGAPVVAVDGPTGLDLSTGEAHGPVRAQLSVTFGGPRRGHLFAREWCGKIVVIDIGFPAADPTWPELANDQWARTILPPLRAMMHKGDRGRVVVVGGDEGMAGAAIHAARAALAAGAGLVKLVAAEPTVRAAQETLPDALTFITALGPQPEPDVMSSAEWADALIVGPGLGRSPERRAFVTRLLQSTDRPAVIDADALQAGIGHWGADRGPRVLTPHPGEFATTFPDLLLSPVPSPGEPALSGAKGRGERETGGMDRFAAATAAATVAGATVLLKGVPTVIAAPGVTSFVSASGNPSLATGGSGDVLSGIIGAFLGRGVEASAAAALGAYAMGRAAEIAAAQHTARATRPADVIAVLPLVW